jgi:hypothetical protein
MTVIAKIVGVGGLSILALGASEARADGDIYALVVGADAYVALPPLHGAGNDARILSDALHRAGAREVVTLVDGSATRAGIFAAFEALASKASAGDWIVFSYAGHGGQEPQSLSGDERDGFDEVMLLPGYTDQAPQNGERIRDNDIYALFSTVRPDVTVLFVADSCHSGTMTRSVDPRARNVQKRYSDYGPVNDTLARPQAATTGKDGRELDNVVFVAASLDGQATPELTIEGRRHGALSFHVAKAIGGAADGDHNRQTTLAEFGRYVLTATRLTSESRQTPDVRFSSSRAGDALPFNATGSPSAPSAPVLSVDPGGAALPPDVPSAPTATADFVWDDATDSLVSNASGDLVATLADPQAMSSAVEKWRVLPQLKALAAQNPLAVDIAPRGAGVRYRDGETVEIVVAPNPEFGDGYLTVINLSADGTLQWLFPSVTRSEEAASLSLRESRTFTVRVVPPFGADHVVAIATKDSPELLRQQLASIVGRRAPGAAANAIETAVAGTAHAVGLVGLYTGHP